VPLFEVNDKIANRIRLSSSSMAPGKSYVLVPVGPESYMQLNHQSLLIERQMEPALGTLIALHLESRMIKLIMRGILIVASEYIKLPKCFESRIKHQASSTKDQVERCRLHKHTNYQA
jgi:hypothetical protein